MGSDARGDPSDASGDADGDGISNLDEFIQGSSPLKDDRSEVKEKDDWAMNNIVYLLIALIALLVLALIIIVFLAIRTRNISGVDEE